MTATAAPRLKRSEDPELVPRLMVRAVAVLVLSVLALVSFARLTDRPLEARPPDSPVTLSRSLLIAGDLSGAARVRGADGSTVADLSPQEGGFVAGVWRVIERERRRHRVAAEGPVVLRGHADGRISIHDPSTGWGADLMGFGADNARAFARLLVHSKGGQ
jgi:putative photosynthetic complex assembly protein